MLFPGIAPPKPAAKPVNVGAKAPKDGGGGRPGSPKPGLAPPMGNVGAGSPASISGIVPLCMPPRPAHGLVPMLRPKSNIGDAAGVEPANMVLLRRPLLNNPLFPTAGAFCKPAGMPWNKFGPRPNPAVESWLPSRLIHAAGGVESLVKSPIFGGEIMCGRAGNISPCGNANF